MFRRYIKKGDSNFDHICRVCGEPFKGRFNQIYCQICKKRETLKFTTSSYPNLCTGTTGAIQELKVSIDLMEKGFDVYRALSPSAKCDLLAIQLKISRVNLGLWLLEKKLFMNHQLNKFLKM